MGRMAARHRGVRSWGLGAGGKRRSHLGGGGFRKIRPRPEEVASAGEDVAAVPASALGEGHLSSHVLLAPASTSNPTDPPPAADQGEEMKIVVDQPGIDAGGE